jgi:hypothetical protein
MQSFTMFSLNNFNEGWFVYDKILVVEVYSATELCSHHYSPVLEQCDHPKKMPCTHVHEVPAPSLSPRWPLLCCLSSAQVCCYERFIEMGSDSAVDSLPYLHTSFLPLFSNERSITFYNICIVLSVTRTLVHRRMRIGLAQILYHFM